VTALLTPVDKGAATRAGRHLWRKQLLPKGTITYEGRKITFDDAYMRELAESFGDRAYDQVPFQLALAGNEHNELPERFRGEVEALEVTPDGLDIIMSATDEGSAMLAENPNLGISARIKEGLERADGKTFGRAIRHVLGTLDPRITGMRPWEAVSLSDADDDEVIDLTGLQFDTDPPGRPAPPAPAHAKPAAEETGMALTAAQEARLGKLLDLPEDRFGALLAGPEAGDLTDEELAKLIAGLDEEGEGAAGEGAAGDAKAEPPKAEAPKAEAPKTEPAAGTAATAPAEGEKELAGAGAALSAEAQSMIDLANGRAEEQGRALARMQARLDAATYEKERDLFARTYGIPPRIFDLARPVLEGEGRTVDLSNGKTADAGAIIREVFKEFAGMVTLLDLSAEKGSAEGADTEAETARQAVEDRATLVRDFRTLTGV